MDELSTDQKGNIAEQAIALAATRLGIEVYAPVGEGGRADRVFLVGERALRVQCKWAARQGDVVVVNARSSRRVANGHRRGVYTARDVDAVAAYCADLDECYFIPIERMDGQSQVFLRLGPAANGQRACIWWARDFEFATIDWGRLGAIAQLEERLHGMQEVAGSSPASSTPDVVEVGANEFRKRFGWYMQRAAAGETFDISRRGRPLARLGPPGLSSALEESAADAGGSGGP